MTSVTIVAGLALRFGLGWRSLAGPDAVRQVLARYALWPGSESFGDVRLDMICNAKMRSGIWHDAVSRDSVEFRTASSGLQRLDEVAQVKECHTCVELK